MSNELDRKVGQQFSVIATNRRSLLYLSRLVLSASPFASRSVFHQKNVLSSYVSLTQVNRAILSGVYELDGVFVNDNKSNIREIFISVVIYVKCIIYFCSKFSMFVRVVKKVAGRVFESRSWSLAPQVYPSKWTSQWQYSMNKFVTTAIETIPYYHVVRIQEH